MSLHAKHKRRMVTYNVKMHYETPAAETTQTYEGYVDHISNTYLAVLHYSYINTWRAYPDGAIHFPLEYQY